MSDSYRPELPWHVAAWRALQPLRARGVHALLLHGAAGIGKKSLALDLVRASLCESRQADGHACGACAGCRLTAAGSHPDLRVVVPDTLAAWRSASAEDEDEAEVSGPAEDGMPEAATEGAAKGKRVSREIRIEQVRALGSFVSTSTHRGGQRAVMLAPAELLNAASANALLKMLEEPPPASLFVLVTDALDDVLPTIRSRCVLVRVPAPAPALAAEWLRAELAAVSEGRPVDAADALAAAGGAPLRALAEAEGTGLEPAVRAALAELLAKGARLTAAEIAAGVPRTVPVGPALALLQRWGWDLLALSSLRTATAVRYHPRESAMLARLASQCAPGTVAEWLAKLAGHRATQEHPLNPRLVIEAALLEYLACLSEAGTAGAAQPRH